MRGNENDERTISKIREGVRFRKNVTLENGEIRRKG